MQFKQLLRQGIVWRGLYLITLFALNIVMNRLLESALSGWANYLTAIFFLVTLLVSVNIESGTAFYVASKLIPRQTVLSFIVLAMGIVTVLTTGGMFAFAHYLPHSNETPKLLAVFGISFVLGSLLSNIFLALFQAEDDFFSGNIVLAIANVVLCSLLLLQYCMGASKTDLVLTYFLFFLVQGLSTAVYYFFKQKPIEQFCLPNKKQYGWLLRYSSLALAANIIFFLVYRVDFWFVNQYCSASDLGNYIQASKAVQLLFVFPQILASVVFPKSAESKSVANIPKQILIITRLLAQCFLLVFIASIFFGKYFFTSVFGRSFATMNLAFSYLLPGILSLSILTLLSAYFSGLNKIKINITGAVLALAVILLGDLLFVKHYGIIAAAIVSSIGYTVNAVYSMYHFFKNDTISVNDLLRFKKSDYKWALDLITNKTD